ncbi:segregation and condensation protein A [Conchiformibius kuhniae]|uniref:Segregation and condensation protein A n=1 Tax=Conchiformibius kuhniae TaxID=211502 RepID=A0ABD8B8M8_9NEIS|nr:ScpA family protein [Conchiformibius kuhniae]
MSTVVAKVFGQTLTDLPADLFIPPDALQVVLHAFEGPLDLLLYLIRKQNIDVLNIPMATVTEQYLAYIAALEHTHFDLAAEYLLMAAVLVEIKSRLLLPQPPAEADTEDAADPRAELVRRLLEYEQIKAAAHRLDALPRAGRDFAWAYLPVELAAHARLPKAATADLTRAWLGILARASHHQRHQITREPLSVRGMMAKILQHLHQNGGTCAFSQLFAPPYTAAEWVTGFIALLELVKESTVRVAQEQPFGEIRVLTAKQTTVLPA